MFRWFGKDKKNGGDSHHEINTMVTLNPPTHFLVVIEGDSEDVPIDLPLTVPFESINHITYVLALNAIPHRVEPLQ